MRKRQTPSIWTMGNPLSRGGRLFLHSLPSIFPFSFDDALNRTVSEHLAEPAQLPAELRAEPDGQEPASSIPDRDGPGNSPVAVLALLNEAPQKGAGRTRDLVDKGPLQEAFAEILELDRDLIDVRTLDDTNQTTRSYSESLGARFSREKTGMIEDWVFVGRLTNEDPTQYHRLAESMQRYLTGLCTAAVFFGKFPKWHVVRIYSSEGREDLAQRIRSFFAVGDDVVVPLTSVRRMAFLPRSDEPAEDELAVNRYSLEDAVRDAFLSADEFKRILSDWRRKKNLVLEGPPGVGKTFLARRLAYALLGEDDDRRVTMVQFHQSTAYEDFVRGWRPGFEAGRFELANGVFYEFCLKAEKDGGRDYVFIIDEINRAHLSKVFGELLMLIEADKRGPDHAIPLIYRKPGGEDEMFYVPENVYVLGMMNTADRSLAMVDFALRRRFAFHKLSPAFDHPAFTDLLLSRGIDGVVIETIKKRIAALNAAIVSDAKNLGPGFEVGHSFFCAGAPVADSEEWYRAVVESEIAPLLHEYWFDDAGEAQKHIMRLMEPMVRPVVVAMPDAAPMSAT